MTPQSHTTAQTSETEGADSSSGPIRFRSVNDIYNATEEVELDDKLLLMGIDEPRSYDQAVKEHNWRGALNREIESIEQNNTWKRSKLPPGCKKIGLKWI